MKIPKFIRENLLLKMTSLNAVVIIIRLIISFFITREITGIVSKGQFADIGNYRNLIAQLTSLTSLGVFNGIVKYVSENKNNKQQLEKLFSTVTVFTILGSILSFIVLFFWADYFSVKYLGNESYAYLIKITAVIIPFISIQRVFNGVINGLSQYKAFSKIELISYIIASALTLWFLYYKQFDGVIISIALAPFIQVVIMLALMFKLFKEYIQFSKFQWNGPFVKGLLAFTLMSFVSTILVQEIEVWIRNIIDYKIGEDDAGIWTGLMAFSKNYMVFSNAILTLYVIPKFAGIDTRVGFMKELGSIYKTLLPLFAAGMILIYFLRFFLIDIQFKGDYSAMAPLFKWQLLGDFIRLASVILATQFIAKKMVYHFIITELLSLFLFYGFAYYFIDDYGVEGVTIAHFVRYIIYFVVVYVLIARNLKNKSEPKPTL
ncbi:MAG: O-antigen translocase [Flavobacteriaceae bacterium]